MHAARFPSLRLQPPPATRGCPRAPLRTAAAAAKPRGSRTRPLRAASARIPSAPALSSSPTTPSTSTAGWEARLAETFDWRRQWYPVAWERDLPVGQPVKVTLFDEDYVVVRGRERDSKVGLYELNPVDPQLEPMK
jgi:hypothetical protein